jgi:hypothetical protein
MRQRKTNYFAAMRGARFTVVVTSKADAVEPNGVLDEYLHMAGIDYTVNRAAIPSTT